MGPLMAPILADMQVYMGPELAVTAARFVSMLCMSLSVLSSNIFVQTSNNPKLRSNMKSHIVEIVAFRLRIFKHAAMKFSSTRHYHMTPSMIPHSSPSELDDTKTVQTGSLSRDPVVSMKFEGHY